MWIKTQQGQLLNTDQVTAFRRWPVPADGSSPADADYEAGLTWRVEALFQKGINSAVIAEGLKAADAAGLLDRVFEIVCDDEMTGDIAYLLRCVRKDVPVETKATAQMQRERREAEGEARGTDR